MLVFHLASREPSDRSFCIYKYARTIHDFPLVLPPPSSPFGSAHRKCERAEREREKKRERKRKGRPWLMIDVLRTWSIDGFFPSPFLRSNTVAKEKKKRRENSRDYSCDWQTANLYIYIYILFPLFDLGDQTRTSLGQVQKQVSEMVPKQGIKSHLEMTFDCNKNFIQVVI